MRTSIGPPRNDWIGSALMRMVTVSTDKFIKDQGKHQ